MNNDTAKDLLNLWNLAAEIITVEKDKDVITLSEEDYEEIVRELDNGLTHE